MNFLGKRCLITGAASGIGRATAELLAQKGARLVLCDIDRSGLEVAREELRRHGAEVLVYGLDVAAESEVAALAQWASGEVGPLDVLINNAGILRVGGILETSASDVRRVMEVNLLGAIWLCQAFVPAMVERGSGAVVNVASASGRVGFAKLAAYSTSKFALIGFSQALGGELVESGVTVSAVCPGFVKTKIAENSQLSGEERGAIGRVMEARGISAEKVAAAIVRAAQTGAPLVHVGRDALAMEALGRVMPSGAGRFVARLVNRSRSS